MEKWKSGKIANTTWAYDIDLSPMHPINPIHTVNPINPTHTVHPIAINNLYPLTNTTYPLTNTFKP
jgi:hypothetical protein